MIEAIGLSRRFGNIVAVQDASFRVPDGTILALLGPNGAGKTTIVRMLTGVLGLTTGRATVAGYDVGRDPAAVRARVGLVTDLPGLHEQMTAPAYLDFFGQIYGLSPAARRRRIGELLAFFDLSSPAKERMVGFSKGMKQKVALARALLHEPAALFLDEPTSGLDPLGARAVRDLILLLLVRPLVAQSPGEAGGTRGAVLAVYLLVVGLMPSSGSIGIAAGLFAGENERGSLLPLLATPASNRAIFAGKVLGAVLPAILYAAVAVLSFVGEIGLFLGPSTLLQLPLALSAAMLALVPADAVLGAGVASVISSRVRTYQSAQMLTSLILYPVMGGLFALALQMQRWGPWYLLSAVVAIVVVDVGLVVLGAATWQREEVIARR